MDIEVVKSLITGTWNTDSKIEGYAERYSYDGTIESVFLSDLNMCIVRRQNRNPEKYSIEKEGDKIFLITAQYKIEIFGISETYMIWIINGAKNVLSRIAEEN